MKSADPKQVAVLGVVAVGAIGYLGYSLVGIGKQVVDRIVGKTEGKEQASESDPSPSQLNGDPFFHPALLKSVASGETAAPSEPGPTSTMSAAGDVPRLPNFNPLWTGPSPLAGSLQVQPVTPKGAEPVDNAGKNRQEEERSRIPVRLSAVVEVERTVAFLSVGGADSRAYGEGDTVLPGWRLQRIRANDIVLVSAKAKRTLSIGQEAAL